MLLKPFDVQVSVEPVHGKKVEHTGVKIELLGQIGVLLILTLYLDYTVLLLLRLTD